MKHVIQIENLQDLIVDKLNQQFEEKRHMTFSDREYVINETLRKIANILLKMSEAM